MGRRWKASLSIGIATAIGLLGLTLPSDAETVRQPGPAQLAATSSTGAFKRLFSVSADAPDDAWAVGATTQTGTLTPYVQHWDGSTWTEVPTPDLHSRSRFNSVSALSPTDVWAVGVSNLNTGPDHIYSGRTLVEPWDGAVWTRVPSVDPSPVETNELKAVVAISADDVWAAGYRFYDDEEGPITLTEHWDGTSWSWSKSGLSSGNYDKLAGVSASSGSDVWAVGHHGAAWAQHWDGVGWAKVQVPDKYRLAGVSAISPTDAWTVGANTLHWDGTAWTKVASPNIGFLAAASATSSTDVWAVSGPNVEHWDGTSWTKVKTPGVGALVGVSAQSPTDAWAVGTMDRKDPLIEHWDGLDWSVVLPG